jgi:hypothetical protein
MVDLIDEIFVLTPVFGIPLMWMDRTKKAERQHRAREPLIRLWDCFRWI